MPFDFNYISPAVAAALMVRHKKARALWIARIKREIAKKATCPSCELRPVWILGGCDLCFSCMTGESDASDDYEVR